MNIQYKIEGLPFLERSVLRNKLNGLTGVYVLRDEYGYVLYIGRSEVNVYERISQHIAGRGLSNKAFVEFHDLIKFVDVYVMSENIKEAEQLLIDIIRPPLVKGQGNKINSLVKCNWLRSRMQ